MIYIAEDILNGEKGDCVHISVVDENNAYVDHVLSTTNQFCKEHEELIGTRHKCKL